VFSAEVQDHGREKLYIEVQLRTSQVSYNAEISKFRDI
jgi:hypothetical protein